MTRVQLRVSRTMASWQCVGTYVAVLHACKAGRDEAFALRVSQRLSPRWSTLVACRLHARTATGASHKQCHRARCHSSDRPGSSQLLQVRYGLPGAAVNAVVIAHWGRGNPSLTKPAVAVLR